MGFNFSGYLLLFYYFFVFRVIILNINDLNINESDLNSSRVHAFIDITYNYFIKISNEDISETIPYQYRQISNQR